MGKIIYIIAIMFIFFPFVSSIGINNPNIPLVSKDTDTSGVSQIIAGSNITISPISGIGVVTISSTGGSGSGGGSFNSTYEATTNDVNANRSAWFSTYNLTYQNKAGTGNCPAGQVVQNTTTGGVQCIAVSSGGGNPFDQVLNKSSNVVFNSINSSRINVSVPDQRVLFSFNGVINGSGNMTFNTQFNSLVLGDTFSGYSGNTLRAIIGKNVNVGGAGGGTNTILRLQADTPNVQVNLSGSGITIFQNTGLWDFISNNQFANKTGTGGFYFRILGRLGQIRDIGRYNHQTTSNPDRRSEVYSNIFNSQQGAIMNIKGSATTSAYGTQSVMTINPTANRTDTNLSSLVLSTDDTIDVNYTGRGNFNITLYGKRTFITELSSNVNQSSVNQTLKNEIAGDKIIIRSLRNAGTSSMNFSGLIIDVSGGLTNIGIEMVQNGYGGGIFFNNRSHAIYSDGTNLIFDTNITNSSAIAWFSGNVSATGYITRTEVWDEENGKAIDNIPSAQSLINASGDINHSKYGVCYRGTSVTDYSKPVEYYEEVSYVAGNNETTGEPIYEKELVKRISYPYKKIEDGVDMVCLQALLLEAQHEYTESGKPKEIIINGTKITALDTNTIIADTILTKSILPRRDTRYTSAFNITKLENKDTHYARTPTTNEKDSKEEVTLDMEKRIVFLEGAMAGLLDCINSQSTITGVRTCARLR